MRDAFGGVFTTNFLLVFIFIYVAVTAVSLNYAKAFRVKNAVIDFVEQREVTDLNTIFEPSVSSEDRDKLVTKLSNLSYYVTCEQIGMTQTLAEQYQNNAADPYSSDKYCYNGVVFEEKSRETLSGTTSEIVHYEVTTYAYWNLGALNKLLALAGSGENSESPLMGVWAVRGDAKVVVKH